MFKVGMKVYYDGSEFWIVSVANTMLELAPTPHGAGSFYTTARYVVPMQQVE